MDSDAKVHIFLKSSTDKCHYKIYFRNLNVQYNPEIIL